MITGAEQKTEQYIVLAEHLKNKRNILIKLKHEQIIYAAENAAERSFRNEGKARDYRKEEGRGEGSEKGEIIGVAAEIAVCQHFHQQFNTDTTPRRGTSDLYIDGHGVDVKCCMPHNNDSECVWVSKTKKVTDSEYFFFVKYLGLLDGRHIFSLYGWAFSSGVINEGFKGDWNGYRFPKKLMVDFSNGVIGIESEYLK